MNCVSISEFCKLTNELEVQENLIQCVKFKNQKIELRASAKQKFIAISLNQEGCLEYTVTVGEKRTSLVLQLLYGIKGKKESCSGYTIDKYGTFLMKLVDALNYNFNVTSCSLVDDATIQAEGKYKGVCLSMLYYLKHGMSWYNSLGYIYKHQKKLSDRINSMLDQNISEWAKYIKNRNNDGWFYSDSGYRWLIEESKCNCDCGIDSESDSESESDCDCDSQDIDVQKKYESMVHYTRTTFKRKIKMAIKSDDIKTIQMMNAFWKDVFLFNRKGQMRTWTKRIDLNTSKPVSLLDDLLSYHRTMAIIKALYSYLPAFPKENSDLAWLSNDIGLFLTDNIPGNLDFTKKVFKRLYMNRLKNLADVSVPHEEQYTDINFTDIKVTVGLLLPHERLQLMEFLDTLFE